MSGISLPAPNMLFYFLFIMLKLSMNQNTLPPPPRILIEVKLYLFCCISQKLFMVQKHCCVRLWSMCPVGIGGYKEEGSIWFRSHKEDLLLAMIYCNREYQGSLN